MVGNLSHYPVDHEVLVSVLDPCHERERFGHESSFRLGADRSMLSKYGHRGVAGIAIKDGKAKRVGELAIALGVFVQFAKLALSHRPSHIGANDAR